MYEFYRWTILGRSLMDVIDEKIKKKVITPEQGIIVAETYDTFIMNYLQYNTNCIEFYGKILSYNFVDGVWKFVIKDFELTFNKTLYRIPYIKIVACDADTSGESGRRRRGRRLNS